MRVSGTLWATVATLCAAAVAASAAGQQPNRATSGLVINYRDGGPTWPVSAQAPNGGLLLGAVYGSPGMPYALMSGTALAPATAGLPTGDTLDLAGAEFFVQSLFPSLPGYFPGFEIPNLGVPATQGYSVDVAQALLPVFLPPGVPFLLNPLQAIIVDPASPFGFGLSAAIQIEFTVPGGVLFVQGVQNPFGFGPQSRLSDFAFTGFAELAFHLSLAGYAPVDETVHTTANPVTLAQLQNYKVVVLAANRAPFSAAEIAAFEAYVRSGGGLLAFSDYTFGIDADPTAPGGYTATCDAYASDNAVMNRFGLEILPDNFAVTTTFTQFVPHPTTRGLPAGVRGEGLSLVRVIGGTGDNPTMLAPSAANGVAPPGQWCVSATPPATAVVSPIGGLAVCQAGFGRVAAFADRNTFLNPPGFGTHLRDASNLVFAINLFHWLAGLD